MLRGWWAILAIAAMVQGGGARADTVLVGRQAQALRCAAYVGMAGEAGYEAGLFSGLERAAMAEWSLRVLDRWLPLDAEGKAMAFWTTLAEVEAEGDVARLLARHGEWCLQAFAP